MCWSAVDPTRELSPSANNQYKKLSEEEFEKLLLRKGQITNFNLGKNRPRLSLAGAQDKCPIFYDGRDYFLPENAAPSTHILKFEISGLKNIPAYEYFLTQLAKKIGLPVVNINLKRKGKHYYLLIERYDRKIDQNNRVKRLHQEDFCQALGVNYYHKYQKEGGPSLLDCYKLVKDISSQPIEDTKNLLHWQIFNILTGNSDGHAKNLSLIYTDGSQTKLAPFYDLVSTRAVDHIDTNLALSIGSEYNPDKILLKHWEVFANTCDINLEYLINSIRNISKQLLNEFDDTYQEFRKEIGEYPALQRVEKIVKRNCKRTLSSIQNSN